MTERLEETNSDKLERVRLMTEPDSKWDLSPKDVAALKHLLAEVERLKKALETIAAKQCGCMCNADPDWHHESCFAFIAKSALAALAASQEAK